VTAGSRTPAATVERVVAKKPRHAKPAQAATPERGRSATAPGHLKPRPEQAAKTMPLTSRRAVGEAKAKGRDIRPAVEATRGKSAAAPGHTRVPTPAKPVKTAKAPKPAAAAKPEKGPKPEQRAKTEQTAKPKPAEQPQPAPAERGRAPRS
jgi:hypothetical protein